MTRVLLAITAALLSLPAFAVTLTFEEFAHDGTMMQLGNTVATQGFVIATPQVNPFGISAVGKAWPYNDDQDSTALTINNCYQQARLTSGDNNPFRIRSIDLADLLGNVTPPYRNAAATFKGYRTDGRVVAATFRLDGRLGWQRAYFSDAFAKLNVLTFRQADCAPVQPPAPAPSIAPVAPYMFDNINIVPMRVRHDHWSN